MPEIQSITVDYNPFEVQGPSSAPAPVSNIPRTSPTKQSTIEPIVVDYDPFALASSHGPSGSKLPSMAGSELKPSHETSIPEEFQPYYYTDNGKDYDNFIATMPQSVQDKATRAIGISAALDVKPKHAFDLEAAYTAMHKDDPMIQKLGRAVKAGFGQTYSAMGSYLKSKGMEGKNLDDFIEYGERLQRANMNVLPRKEFEWSDVLNFEYLATNLAEMAPIWGTLAVSAIVANYVAAPIAGALQLGRFGKGVLMAIGGSALATPMESAFEAGSAYQDAIKRGESHDDARLSADNVFSRNMALLGLTNFASLGMAFVPLNLFGKAADTVMKKRIAAVLVPGARIIGVAGSEGGQERYQEIIQMEAAGEEADFFDLDNARLNEATALGAIFGLGMGGVGSVWNALTTEVTKELPAPLKKVYEEEKKYAEASGLTEQQAELKALDAVAETEEGQKHIEQVIAGIKEKIENPDFTPEIQEAVQEEDQEAPIPEFDEQAFDEKFDALVQSDQEPTDEEIDDLIYDYSDKRRVDYSAPVPKKQGPITADQARSLFAPFAEVVSRSGHKIEFHNSLAEMPDSIEKRKFQEDEQQTGRRIMAAYVQNTDTSHIFTDGAESMNDVLREVLHESIGHAGLYKFMGEELNPFLDYVLAHPKYGEQVRKVAKERGIDFIKIETRRQAAKEWFAGIAEREEIQPTLMTRLIVAFKNALRRMGIKSEMLTGFSDSDIAEIIRGSRAAISGRNVRAVSFGKGAVDYSNASTAETHGITPKSARDILDGSKEIPEGWYVHGRSWVKNSLSDEYSTQMTTDIETANRYAHDGAVWMIRPNKDSIVADFSSENSTDMESFISALEAVYEDGIQEIEEIKSDISGSTGENEISFKQFEKEIRKSFNPESIVISAEAFDNPAWVSLLEYYPGGWPDIVKTQDGAVMIPGSFENVDAVNLTKLVEGQADYSDAPKKPEESKSAKTRIRAITGQARTSPPTQEHIALREVMRAAQKAASAAYRAGNKEAYEKVKTEVKEHKRTQKEKEKEAQAKRTAIKNIQKMQKKMGGKIAVDYQKRINALLSGLDFKKPTAAKLKELEGLKNYLETEGIPLGIKQKHLNELGRLSKVPIRDFSAEDAVVLEDTVNRLYELGKLKNELKLKYDERERTKALKSLIADTKNVDVKVKDKAKLTRAEEFRLFIKSYYMNTLHSFRVADMIDGHGGYAKENAKIIKRIGAKANNATFNAGHEKIAALEKIKALGVETITEDQEVRMMINMRAREGARAQVLTLLKHYKLAEVPKLTETEEEILAIIQSATNKLKPRLAATFEELNNEIFPELPVYYLPLKYAGEDQLIPDTNVLGGYRTTHTFQGMTHSRVSGVQKLPRVDLVNILSEALDEQHWYVEMEPELENIKQILFAPEYKAAGGEMAQAYWRDQLDIIARRGWSNSAKNNAMSAGLRKIRHNMNDAVLLFKASTILMQPFAVFDAAAYANSKWGPAMAAKVLAETTKTLVSPSYAKSYIETSSALQLRQGGELAIEEELAQLKDSRMDKIKKFGYGLISKADVRTAAGVQSAVEKMLVSEGVENPKAEAEFFMDLMNGSSNVVYRPHILSTGEGARTFFTFQGFIMNRWGIIAHDIVSSGLVNDPSFKKKAYALISIGVLMMAGLAEDEARKVVNEFITQKEFKDRGHSALFEAVMNLASTMPGIGAILNTAVIGGSASPPAIRTAEKAVKGLYRAGAGKDSEAQLKGLFDASEGVLSLYFGLPGTAQMYDLAEGQMFNQ